MFDVGDKVFNPAEGVYAFVVKVSGTGARRQYEINQNAEQRAAKRMFQSAWFEEHELVPADWAESTEL